MPGLQSEATQQDPRWQRQPTGLGRQQAAGGKPPDWSWEKRLRCSTSTRGTRLIVIFFNAGAGSAVSVACRQRQSTA